MTTLLIDLNLDEQRWLQFYRRPGQVVVARARTGQSVQFPADRLRPFVTPTGIHGCFKLTIDRDNRLTRIERN